MTSPRPAASSLGRRAVCPDPPSNPSILRQWRFSPGTRKSSAPETADAAGAPAPAALTLALLTFVYFFSYMDRQILAILLELIRKDLLLTDGHAARPAVGPCLCDLLCRAGHSGGATGGPDQPQEDHRAVAGTMERDDGGVRPRHQLPATAARADRRRRGRGGVEPAQPFDDRRSLRPARARQRDGDLFARRGARRCVRHDHRRDDRPFLWLARGDVRGRPARVAARGDRLAVRDRAPRAFPTGVPPPNRNARQSPAWARASPRSGGTGRRAIWSPPSR